MGAYYAYQLINNENELELMPHTINRGLHLRNHDFGRAKFQEGFYHRSDMTQILYKTIQMIGTHVTVNTANDYDKDDNNFKQKININLNPFVKTSFDKEELSEFVRKELKKKKYIKNGYIVCDNRKQYIDISQFDNNNLVISPIALLTRASSEAQGGGDFGASSLLERTDESCTYFEYRKNSDFKKELITYWKDCEIYFTEDISKLNDYTDISKKIYLELNF